MRWISSGLGQDQHVVGAAQVAGVVPEPLAAERGLVQERSRWIIVPMAPSRTRMRWRRSRVEG
jgi:hypothetical protein